MRDYQVIISRIASKELRKLPKKEVQLIFSKIKGLAQPGAQPNAGADGNANAGGNNSGGSEAQDVEYEEVKK